MSQSLSPLKEPVNSESLERRFPDVYRSFFLDYEVVVSGDLCFPLTPGLDWQAGAPDIFHKFPLRVFVGIRREGAFGVCSLSPTQAYDVEKGEFGSTNNTIFPPEILKSFLEEYVRTNVLHPNVGCTIGILTEGLEQHGLSTPVATLLLAAVRLCYALNSTQEIETLALAHTSALFRTLHVQAVQMRSRCYFGISHGAKDFAGVGASKTPTVYVAEERAGTIKQSFDSLFPCDVTDDESRLSSLHWWGYSLSKFGSGEGSFPLDIVSLSHGGERDNEVVASYVKQSLIPGFDALRDEMKQWFHEILDSSTDDRLPSFLKSLDDKAYFQQFIRGHSLKHLEMLRRLVVLYQEPLNSSAVLRLLEILDTILHTHAPFVEPASEYTMHYIRLIKQRADELGVPIAIRALHWGKQDGNLFVYSAPQTFREPLLDLVDEWSVLKSHPVQTEFISWRDGFGSQGLRVDQQVREGRCWSGFEERVRRFTTWRRKKGYSSHLIDQHGPVDVDVLLDTTTHRVFIANKPVTSKDIPSQKATVDIFRVLFLRLGQGVSSRELPSKTYSAFRNDLQGKILGPLDAIVQKRCGTSLGAHIHGSLTDFEVTFDPKTLSIGLIEDFS